MKKKRPPAIWNKKVAENRSETWRKNMQLGKFDSIMNPTKKTELRRERLRWGFSQTTIGLAIGVSTASFAEIEKGMRPVREDRAKIISEKLKKPLPELFKPFNNKRGSKRKFTAREISA